MRNSCKHNGAVLPLSAAPVGRGADGVDAMAYFGNLMMMMMNGNKVSFAWHIQGLPSTMQHLCIHC
jgi:hypothetical protein